MRDKKDKPTETSEEAQAKETSKDKDETPEESKDDGKKKENKDDAEEKAEDKYDDADDEPKVELRIEIRHEEEKEPDVPEKSPVNEEEDELLAAEISEPEILDPKIAADLEYISQTPPTSRLEIALTETLERKEAHIARITAEIRKLKGFISKRKQTYKRKRKDEGAPTRALSAYNIFIKDRFAKLAKENDAALKSADSEAELKRVPPSSLVASTGNAWKDLPQEEKQKYEERAKSDRKRYEEQMAEYQPPDKQANRKRNKTGYNMFFSAHVLRLKQSELGVPSERGSVARLVGTAWKSLSMEEKQYYEREADKHNGMNPVEKEGDEEEEDDKRQAHGADPYAAHMQGHEMHMHAPMHGMHQAPQHDPRHHAYAYPPHHMYGQPPPHGYDYYGHHPQTRHQGGRASQAGGGYQYPPQQGHPY